MYGNVSVCVYVSVCVLPRSPARRPAHTEASCGRPLAADQLHSPALDTTHPPSPAHTPLLRTAGTAHTGGGEGEEEKEREEGGKMRQKRRKLVEEGWQHRDSLDVVEFFLTTKGMSSLLKAKSNITNNRGRRILR